MATTHDIDTQEFSATGKLVLQGTAGSNASVINEGTITARAAGLVGLVAPHVENKGVITARAGHVVLASGSKATLDFYGDGLLAIATDDGALSQSVKNSGTIANNGGTVTLTAASARSVVDSLVENSGTIAATSIGVKNGKIVLSAGSIGGGKAKARNTGTLDASGKETGEKGGQIDVLGDEVTLGAASRSDASGHAGGGNIRIGGDYQGSGDTQKATTTIVESGASLTADAIEDGNGGQVIVWSDGGTWYKGAASARGGNTSGDGGLIEVSGKKYLDFQGTADTRAPHGTTGTLLLDPTNITITNSRPDTQVTGATPYEPLADDVTSYLSVATLQNAMNNGNVTVQTRSTGAQAGDITIADAVSGWSYDDGDGSYYNYVLILDAAHDIIVNAALTYANQGQIVFHSGHDTIINAAVDADTVYFQTGHDALINADMLMWGYTYINPLNAGTSVSMGNSSGTFNLDASELAHFINGKNFIIGNTASANVASVDIGTGSYSVLNATTMAGGAVTVSGDATIGGVLP